MYYIAAVAILLLLRVHKGGGRNPVSPRLLRHFNLICFADFDDATLTRIFDTIGM
jgi:hypothetical protein